MYKRIVMVTLILIVINTRDVFSMLPYEYFSTMRILQGYYNYRNTEYEKILKKVLINKLTFASKEIIHTLFFKFSEKFWNLIEQGKGDPQKITFSDLEAIDRFRTFIAFLQPNLSESFDPEESSFYTYSLDNLFILEQRSTQEDDEDDDEYPFEELNPPSLNDDEQEMEAETVSIITGIRSFSLRQNYNSMDLIGIP